MAAAWPLHGRCSAAAWPLLGHCLAAAASEMSALRACHSQDIGEHAKAQARTGVPSAGVRVLPTRIGEAGTADRLELPTRCLAAAAAEMSALRACHSQRMPGSSRR